MREALAAARAYGITEAVIDQWEASAKADVEAGDPWAVNPAAILAVLPVLRAAFGAPLPAVGVVAFPREDLTARSRAESALPDYLPPPPPLDRD